METEEEDLSEKVSDLTPTTFKELFDQERLPSGLSFEMMPDTIENALAVAEANDSRPWKQKVLQAFAVTSKIGDHDVQEAGKDFMGNILDTDLIFMGLAWSAQMNGMEFQLDEEAPCPSCGHGFKKIGFADLKINCRTTPQNGPGVWKVEGVDKKDLPPSLHKGDLMVSDTTWTNARRHVSEAQWTNMDVVMIHRVFATLRMSAKGGAARGVVAAESRKIRASALKHIVDSMNKHIPYFESYIDLVCSKCKSVSSIPFSQGLG